MAIKGPKGAEPTTRGWVHSRTGELLKSQRITAAQIAEWHGHSAPAPAPAPEPSPVIQTLHEAPAEEHFVSQEEYNYHHVDLSAEEQDDDDQPAEDGPIKLW